MTTTDFIRNFPEIKEKEDKYYLFLGIVSGLSGQEILMILNDCLNQNIFKRKILLNKITISVPHWSKNNNDILFEKIYFLRDSLNSYFKKESASMMLAVLCPYISKVKQNKLLCGFLQSKYKNNRKRAYAYLLNNWSPSYQKIIEKAWENYDDEEIINLAVARMPKGFLLKNFEDISSYFNDEDLNYDFRLKILRNRFYAKICDDIPSEIEKIKDNDPISFIFIMKECGKKIDPTWAVEVYKKYSQSRFLSRWYAEMGLWKNILDKNSNFFRFIDKKTKNKI